MGDWGTDSSYPASRNIDCGGFWPVVATGKFYEEYRLPAELPEKVVEGHLIQAIIRVRKALDAWRQTQVLAGYSALTEVPQETVDNKGEKELLWERAVYCEAKAEILRESVTVDRKKDAENAAKSAPETEEKYREFAADAMRTLVGEARISIELL